MKSEKKYNVLLYGSGGREHALAFKISQSPLLGKLFLAKPNDGFKNLGEDIVFANFEELAKKCVKNSIDLVVIGPELPLSEGIADVFRKYKINCIGANSKWIKLESSKKFAKDFMQKYKIPTAKYFVINFKNEIASVLKKFSSPPVIKADGLAAGKGVYLSKNMQDAKEKISEFLDGKFGDASKTVIVEERLIGDELSVMSLFDGKTLCNFLPARDYKKLYNGEDAPNTGGMGAFCPVKLSTWQKIELGEYSRLLETSLKAEKAEFTGVIYSGLILTSDGIKVLEYNMRFGDPECQALMLNLESDILEIFVKMCEKRLCDVELKWSDGYAVCVVLASKGYPQNPKTNCLILGTEEASKINKTQIFYSGVKIENSKIYSSNGRVMSVCACEKTIEAARKKIYKTIDKIEFKDKIYRMDIGK